MTKVFFLIGLVFFNSLAMGQGKKSTAQGKNNGGDNGRDNGVVVPMRAENWEFRPGAADFEPAGGAANGGGTANGAVMKMTGNGGVVRIKDVDFSDGTIEFDLLPAEKQFCSMYFRWKDSLENECFYFRTDRRGQPQAIQYTPIIGGINCWNLFDNYQNSADWQPNVPIHTKLVVSGRQLRVYLNHASAPALEVPFLEGNVTHGGICFEGRAALSNVVVRHGQVEGLSATEGFDPAANDPHYIRHWQVGEPQPDLLLKDVNFTFWRAPDTMQVWKPEGVERRGLVNLTRLYPGPNFVRRIVFLKTEIHSDRERTCQLQLGFMSEVWVWINKQWLYIDKNYFGTPIAKQRGRISLENSTITVPLQEGNNELLIAVGGGFYGWGVMARIEELEGITIP